MSAEIDPLIRVDVNRIQKAEWLKAYINARASAFTSFNIRRSWEGAGLVPFQPMKVLRRVHIPSTGCRPSTSETPSPFDNSLITSSPTDITVLRTANNALNQMVATKEPLMTPARNYITRLTK